MVYTQLKQRGTLSMIGQPDRICGIQATVAVSAPEQNVLRFVKHLLPLLIIGVYGSTSTKHIVPKCTRNRSGCNCNHQQATHAAQSTKQKAVMDHDQRATCCYSESCRNKFHLQ